MRRSWEDKSDRPLYRQISDRLRSMAASMQPEERLPSETELARELAVSRFTVARAIEELVDDGLIYRRQGAGTFVASPALKRTPAELLSFTEAVNASGHSVTNELLAFAPTEWRHGLPYGRGEALIAFERLRLVDGIPAATHRSVLTAETAVRIGLDDTCASAPETSLYRLFATAGMAVDSGVERLGARLATRAESTLLKLGTDEVVVAVERISYAVDGRPLDFVEALYDAHRFGYESRIVRRHPAAEDVGFTQGVQANGSKDALSQGLGSRHGPWPRRNKLGS